MAKGEIVKLVWPYLMIKTFIYNFSFFPKYQGEDWIFVRVLCFPRWMWHQNRHVTGLKDSSLFSHYTSS